MKARPTAIRAKKRAAPESTVRCPYCHAAIDGAGWQCPGCRTLHHAECAREHNKCTVFGCAKAFAAAAEESRRGDRAGTMFDVARYSPWWDYLFTLGISLGMICLGVGILWVLCTNGYMPGENETHPARWHPPLERCVVDWLSSGSASLIAILTGALMGWGEITKGK